LREALGPAVLQADRDAVSLRPGALVVDAEQLAGLAAKARDDSVEILDFPYGDFLDGKSLEGQEFADWLTFERTRCRNHAQVVLDRAAERYAGAGRHADALAAAQRLLALDSLREQSHRLLMRLHASAGDRSMALAQYRSCRAVLREELGVDPSPETSALARTLAASPAAETAPASDAPPAGSASCPSAGLSIAVLPFANKSGDSEQDYFAEGLSEDIVTELSRQKGFLVIAPQSSVVFGSEPSGAARAASALGVRYVLTGSMRRAGARVRITAQLFDALGDRCVWAERYDRLVEDVFDVQDAVVAEIIASIDAELRQAERNRAARKRPESLDAWELFHRGMWHMYRFTARDTATAEACFRQSATLAPAFGLPRAGLAYACYLGVTWHFVDDAQGSIAAGIGHAEAAVAMDDGDAFSHVVLGRLCTLAGDQPRAIRHLSRAMSLNPSFAQAHFGMAQALFWSGEPGEALRHVDQAFKLSPKDPVAALFHVLRSFCYFWLEDFSAAETAARLATQLEARETWSRLALAISLEARDRHGEAAAAVAEARTLDPKLTLSSFDDIVGRTPQSIRQRVYALLRAAGLADA